MAFLAEEQLGDFVSDLCEITYVDHVPVGADARGPQHSGQLGQLLNFWDRSYAAPDLGEPSSSSCKLTFPLKDAAGEPAGNVYLSANPGRRRSDGQPLFVVQTTARGAARGAGADGVLEFLDQAHTKILSLFLSVTRKEMHEVWGLKA